MNIQLKTIFGELIFEGDFSCLADCVKAALAAKKSLSYANLRYANLSYANLRYANLSYANLRYANLSYANLSYADLSSADLSYADLSYADLSSADLSSANLSSANLSSAKNSEIAVAMTRILPEGNLIGWKKCADDLIVQLLVPTEAKRSHAFGRKCRAEFVRVLQVFKGKEAVDAIAYTNNHGPKTEYAKGKEVRPDSWDDNWQDECGHGIHFFITRLEAEAYL